MVHLLANFYVAHATDLKYFHVLLFDAPIIQLVVVNMTDPDDLQRFYFADHLYAQQLQAQAQLQTETKQRLLQQRKAREAREGKLPATANEAFQSAVNPSSASDATGDEIHTAADLLAHDRYEQQLHIISLP